ncbi:MAG: hypothetical protein Q9180_009965, partial [Flavoplaca navasiana]
MKFINALTIFVSAMAVTAAPAASVDAEVDGLAAPVTAPIEARDLNAAQCRAA